MRQVVILHNQIPFDAPEDVLDILRQAQWIKEILSSSGYEVSLMPYGLSALEKLDRRCIVFNLVDSAPGEESLSYLVPGILESLHLSYTGCSLKSLLLSTDKVLAKRLLVEHRLPTPRLFGGNAPDGLYLVKPAEQDASVGLDDKCLVARNEVRDVLLRKKTETQGRWFAEQYIDGREFTVCMYGSREDIHVLPPYEWMFNDFGQRAKIITYEAKWTERTFGYEHISAKYTHDAADGPLLAELIRIAGECWNVFALHGYARVDFRVDASNRPYVLELNANPSFYGFYHLAKEWGFSFEDIVRYLVDNCHRS